LIGIVKGFSNELKMKKMNDKIIKEEEEGKAHGIVWEAKIL